MIFGNSSKIIQCLDCGIARTHPKPNLGSLYYSHESHYEERFDANREKYKKYARSLLDYINNEILERDLYYDRIKVLDIGAGRGWFISEAIENGFYAAGVEPNIHNASLAQSDGLNVYESIEDLRKDHPTQSFDILTFSSVVEHIASPINFIIDYCSFVKPGGLIIISQAAFDGFLPRFFPWLWYGWQPKEHYWHFGLFGLSSFHRMSGLSDVRITRSSLDHGYCFYGSVIRRLGKNTGSLIGNIGAAIGHGDLLIASSLKVE
jgi:SAM-dependent methyltransferase